MFAIKRNAARDCEGLATLLLSELHEHPLISNCFNPIEEVFVCVVL